MHFFVHTWVHIKTATLSVNISILSRRTSVKYCQIITFTTRMSLGFYISLVYLCCKRRLMYSGTSMDGHLSTIPIVSRLVGLVQEKSA